MRRNIRCFHEENEKRRRKRMDVIIMRGVPGAGKSWWVTRESGKHPVWSLASADIFMIEGGVYNFRPDKLGEAHRRCLKMALDVMIAGTGVLFVDNTNCRAWEIAPYYQAALALGHTPKIIRFHCDPVVAWRRNTHGVPLKQVLAMHEAIMADVLPGWNEEVVLGAGYHWEGKRDVVA
jgi:predicted kinase